MKCIATICCLVLSTANGFAQKKLTTTESLADTATATINQPFADLHLEDTSGQIFNTSSLAGKTIYVDFWFITCPPCMKEIPYAKCLQQFFGQDTNVVFIDICIENTTRKAAWKQTVHDKAMAGIHLFYARNRPQKINLLREYDITFPTYLLVDKEMKVVDRDAPRPSEDKLAYWIIAQVSSGSEPAEAYKKIDRNAKEYKDFTAQSQPLIEACKNSVPVTNRQE